MVWLSLYLAVSVAMVVNARTELLQNVCLIACEEKQWKIEAELDKRGKSIRRTTKVDSQPRMT